MNDTYVELIVKRKAQTSHVILKGVLIGITVVTFLLGLFRPIALIVGVALLVIDYFLFMSWDLEYEYLYVNGTLDIDKIMSKSKRKRVKSLDMDKLEILAPMGSHHLDSYKNGNYKELDVSSGIKENKMYVMIINNDQERLKVIFEPNEKILDCIRMIAPRKVNTY